MAETAWNAHGKQQADSTRRVKEQRKSETEAPAGRAALLRAILSGVSPAYLPGLWEQGGAGIPNSVMLALLSRQETPVETPLRPLPENAPETAPYSWQGTMEITETGAADGLPQPMEISGAGPVGTGLGVS